MGVLLLLRHGQASLGSSNYDQLSPLGHRQARLAGERLSRAELSIDRVICGGLERQRDTALEAMGGLALDPASLQKDERLDEYDASLLMSHQPGAAQAAAKDPEAAREFQSSLDEAIARWAATGDAGPPAAGESHDGFVARCLAVLDDLVAQPGTTLAVTSGGPISVITAHLMGIPEERWPSLARIVVNASFTKVTIGRSGTTLLSFNDHAHFEADRSLVTYR
ncbi:MAG TPA: histidine phosphatase family protein [Frankiaceae bacterium]|jgi:broad specificity phosphatase PhoE|nr:histidine phosphatase family protein [Frankiaceae bacterium]